MSLSQTCLTPALSVTKSYFRVRWVKMQIFSKYENRGYTEHKARYQMLSCLYRRKKEVIKLEALGFGRERISGKVEKGEVTDPESKLGPFASVKASGYQSNKGSSH